MKASIIRDPNVFWNEDTGRLNVEPREFDMLKTAKHQIVHAFPKLGRRSFNPITSLRRRWHQATFAACMAARYAKELERENADMKATIDAVRAENDRLIEDAVGANKRADEAERMNEALRTNTVYKQMWVN